MPGYDYDLFVIGGGSGGVRAARLAASLGKKVAIAEEDRFGGTCVIRGCVPKKLYVYAAQFSEHFDDAAGYGWRIDGARFDWPTLVANKNREIARLEALYRGGLENAGAELIDSRAELIDGHTIRILASGRVVTAEHILVATGGRPNPHLALPGREFCLYSNEAFDLKTLPGSIIIEGGGYIAVEFANIFHGLGVETTLIYRGKEILNRFDDDLRQALHEAMSAKGIRIICEDILVKVEQLRGGGLSAYTLEGQILSADQILLAIGRVPNTDDLGLEAAGIRRGALGEIEVDEYSRTSCPSVWAIGDVTNRIQLTPVAIHEAICLVETIFKDNPTRVDHEDIATAVFSQPEIGTVGLSEEQAGRRFNEVEVYRASFRPMRHTLSGRDEKMLMKLIVDAATRRVVGAHILGPDAGELAQLLAVAIKARLVKEDFDRTMAIHPTAAEELVTMYTPSYSVIGGRRKGAGAH